MAYLCIHPFYKQSNLQHSNRLSHVHHWAHPPVDRSRLLINLMHSPRKVHQIPLFLPHLRIQPSSPRNNFQHKKAEFKHISLVLMTASNRRDSVEESTKPKSPCTALKLTSIRTLVVFTFLRASCFEWTKLRTSATSLTIFNHRVHGSTPTPNSLFVKTSIRLKSYTTMVSRWSCHRPLIILSCTRS